MSVITRSIVVAGAPAHVFDVTQDYAVRGTWDPFPESYALEPAERPPGVGTIVHIRARNGHRMTVRYVAFNRPRAAAMTMLRGPWFIREFAGTWQFKPAGEGHTEVTFVYRVLAAPRGLAWLLQPLLERSFARHSARRLQGLQRYLQDTSASCLRAVRTAS